MELFISKLNKEKYFIISQEKEPGTQTKHVAEKETCFLSQNHWVQADGEGKRRGNEEGGKSGAIGKGNTIENHTKMQRKV